MIVLLAILVIGSVVIFGGGFFIFKVIRTLILEPLKGGSMTGLTFIVLAVFVVILFNKFRKRSVGELQAESYKEQLRRSRRQY